MQPSPKIQRFLIDLQTMFGIYQKAFINSWTLLQPSLICGGDAFCGGGDASCGGGDASCDDDGGDGGEATCKLWSLCLSILQWLFSFP